MMSLLTACLHMGNITFTDEDASSLTPEAREHLDVVADCFQLDADKLAEEDICSAMWADWWGFKMEAYDGIRENIPLVHNAGACAIVHSDSDIGIQRLNQEAAKALADGNRAGLDISKADAWTWLSANPAKSLGIFDHTGSLEAGKDADVVVWSGDPFSVYSQAEKVYIDGVLMFDRNNPDLNPVTDFELGQPGEGDTK